MKLFPCYEFHPYLKTTATGEYVLRCSVLAITMQPVISFLTKGARQYFKDEES